MLHFQVLDTPTSTPLIFRSLLCMSQHYQCSPILMRCILKGNRTYKRGLLPIGAVITQIENIPVRLRTLPTVFIPIDKSTCSCSVCELTIKINSVYAHIKSKNTYCS